MKEIPIRNIYYLLCYAWESAQFQALARVGDAGELTSVQDLLGKVLAGGTRRLVRRGIDRGYVERREDLAGIRGKLAVGETAKRALRARGRAACDFEELSADILANRIVRSSLDSLRRLGERRRGAGAEQEGLDPRVRKEVVSAYHRLGGVSVAPLKRQTFGMVQLDRNRGLYRFLLSVCQLIYECQLADESKMGRRVFHDFRRDEARMWDLFEKFVTGFYRREQDDFSVNKGVRIQWRDADGATEADHKLIPSMEADIVLESPERRIIMDTKYHKDAVGGRYGSTKLKSGNLYQLLTYLRNRQATKPDGAKHEGILLYPEVDEPLEAELRLEGFRIQARTIDLAQPWQGIRDDLLEILRRPSPS